MSLVRLSRSFLRIFRKNYSTNISPRLTTQSLNKLTTSIFDIANDDPKAALSTNQHLTRFYQSIKTQDLELSSNILTDISNDAMKQLTSSGSQNISVEFYFDCLRLVLDCYLNSETFKSINLLRQNVKEYLNVTSTFREKFPEQDDIETDILKVILHVYSVSKKSGKASMYTIPIMEYFIRILASFNIQTQNFITKLNKDELKDALIEICQIKDIKWVPDVMTSKENSSLEYKVPIDRYLDKYGGIDYDGICNYISDNMFNWNNNKKSNLKLFEIYDSLSDQDKTRFMNEYLKFNESKELTIENYTNSIIHASLKASIEFQRSFRFAKSDSDMLSDWVSLISEEVEKLMNNNTPNSDEERILHYFKPFLETVKVESIANYIIQSLLGTGDDNRIMVVLQKMRYSYPSILSQHGVITSKNKVIFKYITDDSYNKLTETFIKIIVENCKITISQEELNNIQNTINLQNRDFNDEFLKINGSNDKYKAFCRVKKFDESIGHAIYTVKVHPYLESKLESFTIGTHLRFLPLLYPPKPWVNSQSGGYLNYQTKFISTNDPLQKTLLRKSSVRGHLDSAYNCLDQIGSTPWAINPLMLDIFNKVMKYPKGFLEIPAIDQDQKLGPKQKKELKNLRSSVEIVNKVANAFGKNGDVLYHCYMLDFRGRVYTFSPLTHYGSDLTRSLFLFWKSQPLGENGFYWVKYQLASLFGSNDCDKFYEQNKDNILESAYDPLNGSKWWMKADKPFCALSVCFEIKNILDYQEKGNAIENYLCRLPIHQDGSCNGLQHYAALAADENGGKAVNLIQVNDAKQDVYIEVMNAVKTKIEMDINDSSLPLETIELARFYLKILSRKLVKRPVMTTVYGVTLAGASTQIKSTIKEIIDDHRTNPKINTYDQETLQRLSTFRLLETTYLARKVLESIDELFGHAKQIENWLLQNTKRILTVYNVKLLDHIQENDPKLYTNIFTKPISYMPMSWIAPSGFPVIQVYRQSRQKLSLRHMVHTKYGNWTKLSPMNRHKNELAIAPNFIHSLDASHMFMTCEEANKQGIAFSAIHDSYWTHPIHVDKLSKILREKFVELYSFDYLDYVKQDFIAQVKGSYQLVEFEKNNYPELTEKIQRIRKDYPEKLKVHKLAYELREMTKQGEDHIMRKLYNEYKPILYFTVSTKTYNYLTTLSTDIPKPKGPRVAIFVPVIIPDVPPKGNLDITKVLDSKYFFS